ncbi:glycoside hydrolase family 3 N-terminal domain-containing protein [Sphingobacterium spiritivorum]|uniref:glycoside hydrolase family 3 N-terminal domain-containing protein n=1 Tax=Sphingobacterium spiritivorum TaxID=258 RepID=UPI003DA32BD7
MKKTFIFSLLLYMLFMQTTYGQKIYLDPKFPISKRVDDLLARMTVKEKILQLAQYTAGQNDNPNNIESTVKNMSPETGSLILFSADPLYRNRIQKNAIEQSRLGIPILFGNDIIHGYRTLYPIPLAQAASWNLDLVRQATAMAAKEARYGGIDWTFAPMIDVAYDARWGRVSEGYGEDPYANAVFGVASVKGYQGEQPFDSLHIAACAKHFVGYSRSEGGRDYQYTDISNQALWETYLPPYKAVVKAGVATVMSSFNDINGTPSIANHYLLTDVLRKQWGFKGFVVSDWDGIAQLVNQGVAQDNKEATRKSFLAGTDMSMVDGLYDKNLPDLLKEKQITEAQIDESVRRILTLKFQLGLFEKPYTTIIPEKERNLTPENLKIAEQFAAESMVLLKNSNHILPLSQAIRNVAVIGPMAKDQENVLSSWAAFSRASDVLPFYDGMLKEFDGKINFEYSAGVDFERKDIKKLKFESVDTAGFKAAYDAALRSDLVLLCLGEKKGWTGENASRSTISLPAVQEELVKRLSKAGKPIVLILSSGRPIELMRIEPLVDAIIEVWQPGTAGSMPLAGILSGRINPSGKLPITFPYTTGQIPIHYNRRPSPRPVHGKYQDIPSVPLYEFGHGLSYTTYEYNEINLSKTSITSSEKITATIKVKNTGNKDGLETVHWFISDPVATISRPVKELKHFEKKMIKAGETVMFNFDIVPERDLTYPDANGKDVLERGDFYVIVGNKKVKFLLK